MNIKKTILVGGLALASLYGLYVLTRPRWDTKAGDSISSVLEMELSEPKDEQYLNVAKSVDQLLKNKPEYANSLLQKCIKNIESAKTGYQPVTSLMMFDAVRKKAEDNPMITEYLGMNAKSHIRGMRITGQELGDRAKQALGDLKDKIKEVYEGVKPKEGKEDI